MRKIHSLFKFPLHILILSILSLQLLLSQIVYANNNNSKTPLPLPRFVSLKFNKVHVRTGPSYQAPIEWTFLNKGEPVKIVAEYEQWREIEDIEGKVGWVHYSGLSTKKSIIITTKVVIPLLRKPIQNAILTTTDYDINNDELQKYINQADVVAQLAPNLRCNLSSCKEQWCQITCLNYKGWVPKGVCWGVE